VGLCKECEEIFDEICEVEVLDQKTLCGKPQKPPSQLVCPHGEF